MSEIRTAAEQLAAEQEQRKSTAERVTGAVGELNAGLEEFTAMAEEGSRNGASNGAGANGHQTATPSEGAAARP
jgi:methyl-accepting chemotaxis protein